MNALRYLIFASLAVALLALPSLAERWLAPPADARPLIAGPREPSVPEVPAVGVRPLAVQPVSHFEQGPPGYVRFAGAPAPVQFRPVQPQPAPPVMLTPAPGSARPVAAVQVRSPQPMSAPLPGQYAQRPRPEGIATAYQGEVPYVERTPGVEQVPSPSDVIPPPPSFEDEPLDPRDAPLPPKRPSYVPGHSPCASGCATGGCEMAGCCSKCNHCGCRPCCCRSFKHVCSIFIDPLAMSARDQDVVYAVQVDGNAPANMVPMGDASVADNEYQPGVRVGATFAFSESASLVTSFIWWESEDEGSIVADAGAGLQLQTTLLHPNTLNAGTPAARADAEYDMEFILADVAFRSEWRSSPLYAINYQAGVRYAGLEQKLDVEYSLMPTDTTVRTDIDFDGIGVQFGLDAERWIGRRGVSLYARGLASFIAGEFRSNYYQASPFQTEADLSWEDDRVISILEYELGTAWTCCNNRMKFSAGYVMAAWLNTVSTDDFVQAVQAGDYADVSDTLLFDGLVGRIEWRY